MLDVDGLTAQGESGNLGLRVSMRDVAGGPFPTASGCPSFAAPSGPLAFTGAQGILPVAVLALALVAGGLVLILRRRRNEEAEK
jgi:LPXTG-motif cell wall-anchored protein